MPTPLTVTVDDALGRLGIGRTTFYSLVGEGRIDTIKCGRRTLVKMSSLERFVDEAPTAGRRAAA